MLFCILVGGGGQLLSLLNWDLALRFHFQENDPNSPDTVQRMPAQIEWGVCAADVFLVVPLFAADLAGVIFRRRWGQMTAMAASACWVYMFLVYPAQRYALVFRGGMGTGATTLESWRPARKTATAATTATRDK